MKKTKPDLSPNDLGTLLMVGATIFGGWVRILPPVLSGFPINDGGLFFMMMTALRENGYQIPHFIQYNGLNIPFAYPPLAFYIGTLTGSVFKVTDLEILRWLPAIVTTATIPAFFFLAKAILKSPLSAGLASIIFALLPHATIMYIMGGGLTRSFGLLFLILSANQIYLLFTNRTKKHLWLASIFSAMVVLVHPEAAIHTLGIGVFFWFMLSRNWIGFKDSLMVGLLVVLITSIWWIPLFVIHGISPLLSASKTGLYGIFSFARPLLLTITGEPFATVVSVLFLLGIVVQVAKREYLIPAWLIMHFIIEKRNATNVAIIPVSLLAAIAIYEMVLPAIQQLRKSNEKKELPNLFSSGIAKGFVVFLGLYLLAGMGYTDMQLVGQTVSEGNREAFHWIAKNTSENSRFIILTGKMNPFEDGVNEWFPVFSERTSATTLQGTEWLDGDVFTQYAKGSRELERCLHEHAQLPCIENVTAIEEINYEYIYIARNPFQTTYLGISEQNSIGDKLIAELAEATDYELIYQTEDVVIFKTAE